MSEIRLTADSPGYVSVWEIENDLYDFSKVINRKYSQIDFDFVFLFQSVAYNTGHPLKSPIRERQ